MRTDEIETAVLANVTIAWRKVAMVIAKTSETFKPEIPLADQKAESIAKTIEELIKRRRIESQGDIKNWRHSEIRLYQA